MLIPRFILVFIITVMAIPVFSALSTHQERQKLAQPPQTPPIVQVLNSLLNAKNNQLSFNQKLFQSMEVIQNSDPKTTIKKTLGMMTLMDEMLASEKDMPANRGKIIEFIQQICLP